MARGWVLQDSTVDALELPDDLKTYAREMAGESAVQLTDDRERILLSAALEVELYCGRMFFTGAAGSARACTSIVEVDGRGDVPAIPQFPKSAPVLVTAVAQWDDAAAAYVTAEYVARPLGAIRVSAAGSYRILAGSTPNPNYPTVIDEAVARLFSYRESYKPRKNTSDISDGNAPSITGAMMRSGAAECIRFIRSIGRGAGGAPERCVATIVEYCNDC